MVLLALRYARSASEDGSDMQTRSDIGPAREVGSMVEPATAGGPVDSGYGSAQGVRASIFALELIRVLGFPSVNTSYSSFGSAWCSNSLLCSEHA